MKLEIFIFVNLVSLFSSVHGNTRDVDGLCVTLHCGVQATACALEGDCSKVSLFCFWRLFLPFFWWSSVIRFCQKKLAVIVTFHLNFRDRQKMGRFRRYISISVWWFCPLRNSKPKKQYFWITIISTLLTATYVAVVFVLSNSQLLNTPYKHFDFQFNLISWKVVLDLW